MTHTDGSGVAGLLQEIFASEITSIERICQSCGSRNPTGAHRAYTGAGVVLRCPACEDVALRIGMLPSQRVVELRGTWIFGAVSDAPPGQEPAR
jgi:hypothetical protein